MLARHCRWVAPAVFAGLLLPVGHRASAQQGAPTDKVFPISLPTALRLANVRPLDIAVASQRIRLAAARLERAEVLWLPTIYLGMDYFRHDGKIQTVAGDVISTSKSSLMLGAGPSAVIPLADAYFEPLAARQVWRARTATLQAARNDSLLAVAEAYFNVEQAAGELAGALAVVRQSENLVQAVAKLAPAVVPEVEISRARADLAEHRQAVHSARERWRTASAELVRVLRLDPSVLVQPQEPPHLRVTLLGLDRPVDDFIPVGLTNRPELAAQQALVRATLERLRLERLRPLIPSVLLRGAATPVTGTLSSGYFGGGINSSLRDFSARNDLDLQVLWEFQNLGFGNRARVHERQAENQLAVLELFRTQDRVAAEVARADAEAVSARDRLGEAETGLKEAAEALRKNVTGLSQTKQLGGNVILLVIRPQEVIAAVGALARAYNAFYGVVADYNRAQFRLYRALGHPAQLITCRETPAPVAEDRESRIEDRESKIENRESPASASRSSILDPRSPISSKAERPSYLPDALPKVVRTDYLIPGHEPNDPAPETPAASNHSQQPENVMILQPSGLAR
jgi:outer membrane protein TolC